MAAPKKTIPKKAAPKKAAGRPNKEFQQYLCEPTRAHVSHSDYLRSPATTFLKYMVEAKSAIDLCLRIFTIKKNGDYTKDSKDSIQHLECAMLPAIMGHFETYQKSLFAGMFDLSVHLTGFNPKAFINTIKKDQSMSIDPVRLSAYRDVGSTSIGLLIADSLSDWHNPVRVNEYIKAFTSNQFYTDANIERLRVLWQLRHSIVHTGGTLTQPDAQKVGVLNRYAGANIAFEDHFIYEVARKFHRIIKESTESAGAAFKARRRHGLSLKATNRIDEFFDVDSTMRAWIR